MVSKDTEKEKKKLQGRVISNVQKRIHGPRAICSISVSWKRSEQKDVENTVFFLKVCVNARWNLGSFSTPSESSYEKIVKKCSVWTWRIFLLLELCFATSWKYLSSHLPKVTSSSSYIPYSSLFKRYQESHIMQLQLSNFHWQYMRGTEGMREDGEWYTFWKRCDQSHPPKKKSKIYVFKIHWARRGIIVHLPPVKLPFYWIISLNNKNISGDLYFMIHYHYAI